MAVSGFSEKDIHIELLNGVLTIEGNIKEKKEEEGPEGEAWCHLQACREVRQGVPRPRACEDPSSTSCQARGYLLHPC